MKKRAIIKCKKKNPIDKQIAKRIQPKINSIIFPSIAIMVKKTLLKK
jgi:hypothetical protein